MQSSLLQLKRTQASCGTALTAEDSFGPNNHSPYWLPSSLPSTFPTSSSRHPVAIALCHMSTLGSREHHYLVVLLSAPEESTENDHAGVFDWT